MDSGVAATWFLGVPDVIWAAVVASLLTLAGVLATNWGSYKRLIKQLSHDSEQRDRERNMDLRSKVFLEATEAITANHLILMQLSDLNIPDAELSGQFAASAAAISKVNIIGSDETVKTVTELSVVISTQFLQLFEKRLPLIMRQQDINGKTHLRNKCSAEVDRMIELMKQYNLQGSVDTRLFDTIKTNFEFENNRCDDFIKEIDQLQTINNKEQIQLTFDCLKASKEVSKFFLPAISAVREEMDLPFDEDLYKTTIEKAQQATDNSVSEFFENIKKGDG